MMKLAGCICLRLTQFGAKPVIITVGERSSDGFALKTEGVISAVCDTAGNLPHTTKPLIKLHAVVNLYVSANTDTGLNPYFSKLLKNVTLCPDIKIICFDNLLWL